MNNHCVIPARSLHDRARHGLRGSAAVVAALSLAAGLALTPAPAEAGPRLDKINETKVLRVGTPGDYRPFAIKQGDGYSGHDVDLIERVAKELNAKVEYVPTTWKTLLPDLQADKFDIAVGGITRTAARIGAVDMLPGYAPFGKVALIRADMKGKLTTLDSLNQPGVRVIKNPGGTNEQFVLANLKNAEVITHEKNAEIPGLIAEGKGDVMITETYEALHYAKADPRLYAAFIDAPLTPPNTLGFMLPKDDADYTRVMHFVWGLLEDRGAVKEAAGKWLK